MVYLVQYAYLIALAGWGYALVILQMHALHTLQLEDYDPVRLWRFQSEKLHRWLIGPELFGMVIVAAVALIRYAQGDAMPARGYLKEAEWQRIEFWAGIGSVGLVLWGLGSAVRGVKLRRSMKEAKKKLNFTPRARRIFIASLGFASVAFLLVWGEFPRSLRGVNLLLELFVIQSLAMLWASCAVWVLQPFENASQRRYLEDARRILGEVKPLVVGVTGSYGKTGTKEMLAAMLADRYNIYRPPGSYNTLMGVTRAIREGLRPYHEAFVVETGAYREGSIAKVCDLVHPQHGIVTAVGLQHLERFGSQEVIQRAKGELVRALPVDGVAVLNGDDPLCRQMAKWHEGEVRFFQVEGALGGRPVPPMYGDEGLVPVDCGVSPFFNFQFSIFNSETPPPTAPASGEEKDDPTSSIGSIRATNIRVGISGSDFDLQFPDGEVLPVHLSLLGRAAIANATAAATLADRLGVARPGIARALTAMPHVRHRLEPTGRDNGILVLDDAFNSNPTGTAVALEVLASAVSGRRVLVTPGMIELGEVEEAANRVFGKQAAKACDLAVLIGVKRIEPIRRGLVEGGCPEDAIWVYPSLSEALQKLGGWLKPGDVMLLENDLPDQYAGL